MNTPLFNVVPTYPQGFRYIPDFLTHDEEDFLLQAIADLELHTFLFQGYEAKRKVASFGYDYSFDQRKLAKGKEIPVAFQPLIAKVAAHVAIAQERFAELLVTEYPRGAVINWHRDAPPFDLIAGISLLSDCIFRLRPQDERMRSRHATVSIPVKRRSLYIIEQTARTDWQHSILPVESVRYSITLRTLK